MIESGKAACEPSPAVEGVLTKIALRPSPFLERWRKPIFILCLILWGGNLVFTALRIDDSPTASWCEGFFIVFATICTLVALGRRLPLQNVVATAAIIALFSGGV